MGEFLFCSLIERTRYKNRIESIHNSDHTISITTTKTFVSVMKVQIFTRAGL